MDPIFCRLAAMDPHFQCASDDGRKQQTPGLECLSQDLMDSTARQLNGSTLVFVGDSTSLQMWLAMLVLLVPRFTGLSCPDLSLAYRGDWGNDGKLRCAQSRQPEVQICYAKASMVQANPALPRSSATSVIRGLLRNGNIDSRCTCHLPHLPSANTLTECTSHCATEASCWSMQGFTTKIVRLSLLLRSPLLVNSPLRQQVRNPKETTAEPISRCMRWSSPWCSRLATPGRFRWSALLLLSETSLARDIASVLPGGAPLRRGASPPVVGE